MYFSKKGITSTHAAHIKNMCKEICQEDQIKLKNINVIDASISLIGSTSATVTSVGVKSLGFITKSIDDITQAYSLSAWLAEAIKAKDELLKSVDNIGLVQYCKEQGIECPRTPVTNMVIGEEDIIKKMSPTERCKYLMLETRAAHIGKLIHSSGDLSDARKKALNVSENPSVTQGSGRDMCITQRTVSVDIEELNKLYFDLQNEHRKAQAELNQIKSNIKKQVDDHNLADHKRYENEFVEYQAQCKVLKQQMEQSIILKKKEISDLKILIPSELQEFYNLVDSMGK